MTKWARNSQETYDFEHLTMLLLHEDVHVEKRTKVSLKVEFKDIVAELDVRTIAYVLKQKKYYEKKETKLQIRQFQ